MAKSPQENPTSNRQKQLNVVYFIDSARTRSFRMPVTRVNLLLLLFACLIIWSFASIALLVWQSGEKRLAENRVKDALATVFDYETRYDDVYEIAYPLDNKGQPNVAATKRRLPELPTIKPVSPKALAKNNPQYSADDGTTQKSGTSATTALLEESEEPSDEAPIMGKVPALVKPATQESTDTTSSGGADIAALSSPPAAASDTTSDSLSVAIENPVLETTDRSLELRFDIKSKGRMARAEGYVWAIAEFKSDRGKTTYIGEPSGIEVKADGEPKFPRRSNKFAVRFFKRKRFSFPLNKDAAGTFLGVRIGVMANRGDERMIYNVPVNIRVGESSNKSVPDKVNPG